MTIESFLAQGPATAMQIRRATGLSHEEVYERLVHLEAVGIVSFVHDGTRYGRRLWRFAE